MINGMSLGLLVLAAAYILSEIAVRVGESFTGMIASHTKIKTAGSANGSK